MYTGKGRSVKVEHKQMRRRGIIEIGLQMKVGQLVRFNCNFPTPQKYSTRNARLWIRSCNVSP